MKQASRLAQGFIVGTISVKRSQLVLFPASAVMRVPIILTVDLDASGAAHLYTLVRFVKGGQQTSGRHGGCTAARTSTLGFLAETSSSAVDIEVTFDEPGDYGVCYLVNATTRPGDVYSFGEESAHWLAWDSRVRVQYPIRSLQGSLLQVDALTNKPLELVLVPPFIGASIYRLAGDIVKLVPGALLAAASKRSGVRA